MSFFNTKCANGSKFQYQHRKLGQMTLAFSQSISIKFASYQNRFTILFYKILKSGNIYLVSRTDL